jgi:hypothetical protein
VPALWLQDQRSLLLVRPDLSELREGGKMSASEKLKALLHDARIAERGMDNDIHGEPLLVALPQIVAVVEAAERCEHEYELCREGADDGEFALWSEPRLYTTLHNLRPALADLEKALS